MKSEEDNIKKELFLKGLNSFNQSEFYDAHEHWEDLWSDYRLSDAKFVQALIQLAVGYFHITNLNKNGAIGLLTKCKPKFEMYVPNCRGIDTENILVAVDNSLDCLKNIDEIKEFDWSLVPKLVIENV
tara:strand:- start:258 stop:641 length:384 start_codon:yes stop_codon:yes gene_type:complete